jgi:CheY-like chemotaxis protein
MAESIEPAGLPEGVADEATASLPVRYGDLTLLLVDDSKSMLLVLEGLLKGKGFGKITTALNGESALSCLRSGKFDVILCDWDMPVMNGMQLLKEVKADAELKEIPFLMVTMHTDRNDILKAIRAGVDDYVVKPVQVGSLVKKIADVVRKKRQKNQEP